MKTPSIITVISTLTLVAGCAHHEHYATYDDTISSPAYGSSTYNSSRTYNNSYSSVSPGGSPNASASSVYTSQPGSPEYSSTGTIGAARDENLTVQVQQSIYNDNNLVTIAPQIHVMAQPGGMVMLSGTVPNAEQKQVIERRVKQVAGVVNVRNDIQVSFDPTGRTGHSSRIYSNSISGASSQVSPDAASSAGVSGQVDLQNKPWESKQIKPTSNSSANRQYGSYQSVAPASTPAQPAQSSQGTVEDKYASPSAASPQSSATSDTTPPSSSGTSADPSATKSTAVDAALNSQAAQTPGASTAPGTTSGGTEGVNVQVQGTTDSDRAVGQQVTQQLRADSDLLSVLPMLHIKVENGKATLSGNVNSEDQKKKVESTVQQVTGVSSVENQLHVTASTSGTTNP